MISAGISGFLLLAVLTAFLMIGRSGWNVRNYTELEAQSRRALEMFSREAREAYAVASGYSATSVTLSIPDTSSSRTTLAYNVTYTFNTSTGNFTRTGPPVDNPSGTSSTTTLISGVQQISGVNPFNYYRFVTGGGYSDGFGTNTAANVTEIKQIEINFLLRTQSTTVAAATNRVLSARFILRNK